MIKKIILFISNVFADLILFFVSLIVAREVMWKLFFGDCDPFSIPIIGPGPFFAEPLQTFGEYCYPAFPSYLMTPFVLVLTILIFILLMVVKDKVIIKFIKK